MKIKKAIGKMGNLAKSSVEKTSHIVREGYEGAKRNYPEVKSRVGKAADKANRVANRGMDYAVRVRNNASESPLFKEPTVMRPTYDKVAKKGRKKKRKSQNKRSGFSLI